MSHGGLYTYLPDLSIHPEVRYDPGTQDATVMFLPYQAVAQVAAKDRFRPVSPLGKLASSIKVTASVARQPVERSGYPYIQPPSSPTEGRLTLRGYVDGYESQRRLNIYPEKATYTWSP